MNGYDRNKQTVDKVFNNREALMSVVCSCIVNDAYVSIPKLIESNIRLYDLIKGKHAENGYVIISACRDSYNPAMKETNNANTNRLKADIRNQGYSYMPVYGGYVEDENGEVLEASFIIFNYDRTGKAGDFEDLKRFAIDMCGKYNQDSVLIYEPEGIPAYYDRNGNVVSAPSKSSKNVKINDESQPYFTEFKNKSKRYTYDVNFPDELESSLEKVLSGYDYFAKPPSTYNERYRRYKLGELFL